MKYKSEHLPFSIIIILIIIEFVFFLSNDWGKNCRNTVRGITSMQAATSNYAASKRYCLTLNLKDDPDLISEYKKLHEHVWPEITAGFAEVGIVDMEIYIQGNKLFMILETVKNFDLKKDFERMGKLPSQKEWENLVSKFQDTDNPESIEKWQTIERIFRYKK
ncbi:L-rhamnose mutarotase [Mariniphaga sediminis]|nr:L-rhamnose mutarotase [Mariniphaga sediminis]